MRTKLLYNACKIAVIPVLSFATPSMAQVALEEIVVTASKRAESLQDVPIAVNTLSG